MKNIILAALALATPLFGHKHGEKHATAPAFNPIIDSSPEALVKDGFVSLIKGDTLDGWTIKGSEATFVNKDGEINGSAKDLKGNSFLCTDKTYGDFIYTFQFKFNNLDGNSGCMFRALQNEKGRVNGYQCEGDNKERSWTAGLFDEARRGWLFPSKPKKPKKLTPEQKTAQAKQQTDFTAQGLKVTKMDDWNQITIKCVGNHIQTWLNGELRVDFKDTDPEHSTPEGFFGLQVHGGPSCDVSWRNIYLKELK